MTFTEATRPDHAVLDVIASNGVPFRVVAYAPGATGPYALTPDKTRQLVEFYDRRYPHTEHGQFTGARYYADDIMRPDHIGLLLDAGIDAWRVDGITMAFVAKWLDMVLPRLTA